MTDLKALVEQWQALRNLLAVAIAVGAAVGTGLVVGYFQFRKWSRKLHRELTDDSEEGGLRQELAKVQGKLSDLETQWRERGEDRERFQEQVLDNQAQTIQRLGNIESYRGSVDTRLNEMESRHNRFEERLLELDRKFQEVDDRTGMLVDQGDMLLQGVNDLRQEFSGFRCSRPEGCPGV